MGTIPNDNLNIAVIASGIDEEYQQSVLLGIQRYAKQHHVNIAHFIAFGGMLANPKYDLGEYNIFELPNFSQFDGAILLSNTFSADLAEMLRSRIEEAGIPAVSLDRNLEGFYFIGIENASAMEQITRHFIEIHGVRRFYFVSGPDDNSESQERLQAFSRVLKEYAIPFADDQIYHGTFRGKDGRRAAELLLQSGQPLPEAIVCANDAMAISVLLTLEANGIRCPEDILVSGFDNIYNARNFSPTLTTVERPLLQSGALACELICRHTVGEDLPMQHALNAVPVYAESCGCHCSEAEDIALFKKRNFQVQENTVRIISRINQLSCSLVECDRLDELTDTLKAFICASDCEEFYLCLNDNWYIKQIRQETGYIDEISADNYTVKGYSKRILMPLAYYDGVFHERESFVSTDMLPYLKRNPEHWRAMYFVPLHFRERCLGYFVMVNSELPMHLLFHTWSITLSNSLENLRKLLCLDEVVQELDRLYAIDSLTGIFNRNGFQRSANALFQDCIAKQLPVMIMFVDMDGLKYVNDSHGHKEGDRAIRTIASILQVVCMKQEITCRFGGDEFFIFAADYTEEDERQLRQRIHAALDLCNRHGGLPYRLCLSLGSCVMVPQPGSNVFQLISLADNRMYEEKKKKNPSKYLKQGL